MATKIVTKNSSTAGAAPTATDLVQGELAVNVADGRLYTEDNAAAIVELGVNPATEITANAGIALPDSQKATFGAGDDLEIYHSGSHSFISDVGTGNLYLQAADSIILRTAGVNISATFTPTAGVDLNYTGSTKLATTSTGIDVTGTATMDGLTVDTNTLVVDATNNRVGIRNSSPSYQLDLKQADTYAASFENPSDDSKLLLGEVSGDWRLAATYGSTGSFKPITFWTSDQNRFTIAADGSLSTPTLGTSNVRFGVNAGNSIASGGNYNVVVGDEAGTAITTGDQNVAIGFESLKTEDTGSRNTAVGAYTLNVLNNDAQSYNTAMGYAAGLSVTTGVQNTLIGGLAGDALTDADFNVAMGYAALSADTLGSNSTAIGWSALAAQNFTSATLSYNTAVGFKAGLSVTTGVNNTLIGGLAGDALTIGGNNVAIGRDALGAETTGQSNIAIGRLALGSQNNTGSPNTYNIGIGTQAGYAVTTGTNNTLIGGLAGDALTTGSYNNAFGHASLSAATTGEQNAAFGRYSLNLNTTGSENTAVGNHALNSNTTADSNTAVGYFSLYANTTASNNTAVGFESLVSNTTGSENQAFGVSALSNNTTGSDNTAIGRLTLRDATTAIGNTAVGEGAGALMTTGSKNTLIGRYTGNSNGLDIRTTSNNIVLSDGDGVPKALYTGAYNKWAMSDSGIGRITGSYKTITVADDATVTLVNAELGACLIHVYDTGTGDGGVYFATYKGQPVRIASAGSYGFATADQDGNYCVYKSSNSHALTFKNRTGASRNITILITGGRASSST